MSWKLAQTRTAVIARIRSANTIIRYQTYRAQSRARVCALGPSSSAARRPRIIAPARTLPGHRLQRGGGGTRSQRRAEARAESGPLLPRRRDAPGPPAAAMRYWARLRVQEPLHTSSSGARCQQRYGTSHGTGNARTHLGWRSGKRRGAIILASTAARRAGKLGALRGTALRA